jgi:hypothetical protein
MWALCSYVIKYILQGCSVLMIFKAYIPTYFMNSILCFYFFTAVPKKPSNMVPKIRFLSLDEFASIPKYMKGRVILVVEFSRGGYKIIKFFGYKSIFLKETIVFCELMSSHQKV